MGARLGDAVVRFRVVSLVEGLSYLVLLFIAMPMKYLGDDPRMVQVVGRLHGLLFVLFLLALAHASAARGWTLSKSLTAFGSSLVPFGALWLERKLRAEDRAEPATP